MSIIVFLLSGGVCKLWSFTFVKMSNERVTV